MCQRDQALKVVSGGSSKAPQLAQAREEGAAFFGSSAAIFFSAVSSLLFFAFLGDVTWYEPGNPGIVYSGTPSALRGCNLQALPRRRVHPQLPGLKQVEGCKSRDLRPPAHWR